MWKEIEEFFQAFNLSFGDTSVITDHSTNLIKALHFNDEAMCPCLAHRSNTVLATVWENLLKNQCRIQKLLYLG